MQSDNRGEGTMSDQDSNSVKSQITVHNKKSNYFRDIHADGVFGGVTPHLLIHMSFYTEYLPIPEQICHEVVDGKLGKELERFSEGDVIREFQVGVIMNLDIAKSMLTWLEGKIKVLEDLHNKKNLE